MQYTATALLALFAATSVSAAPTVQARAADWTITSFKRTCNTANTSCTISFGIDTHLAPVTACAYTVTGAAPVSRASTGPVTCGAYTVTSSWSGQFGDDAGFTTWAVADGAKKLIAFPAYADKEIVNEAVVTPNKSFAVDAISW